MNWSRIRWNICTILGKIAWNWDAIQKQNHLTTGRVWAIRILCMSVVYLASWLKAKSVSWPSCPSNIRTTFRATMSITCREKSESPTASSELCRCSSILQIDDSSFRSLPNFALVEKRQNLMTPLLSPVMIAWKKQWIDISLWGSASLVVSMSTFNSRDP